MTLLGPPGIGKSRLVREFTTSVPEGTTVAVGRCLSYGESTSVFALDAVVRDLVGNDIAEGLAHRLADVERGEQIADRVAIAIGAGGRGGPGEEIQWAFRRLLERIAADGPLVVALDDLHWAEPWLLDLVEYLAAFADGPIVLVALARPELLDERPSWAGPEGPGVLAMLDPLSPEHTEELVDGPARRRVAAAGRGAPLRPAVGGQPAVRRAGRGVRDRAVVRERDGAALDAARAAAGAHRPADRGGARRARARRHRGHGLPPPAARRARARRRRGRDGATVLALMRKGFVGPGPRRARRATTRSASATSSCTAPAYESVPKERRARLHLRFADWLEQREPGADAMLGPPPRAGVALRRRAGRRRRSPRRARPARRRLPRPRRRGRDRPQRGARRGRALRPGGSDAARRLDRARRRARRARRRAADGGSARGVGGGARRRRGGRPRGGPRARHAPTPACCACRSRCRSIPARRSRASRPLTARAATRSSRDGDELGMCRVEHTRALGHWFAGRCQAACEAWERAASHARRGSLEWALPDMLAWVASSLQLGPEPVPQAIVRCERLREETQSHPLWQAFVMRPLGLLYAMNGELERSRAVFEECDRLLDEMGETIHSAAPDREAEAALLEGDAVRAERLLRDGFDRLEAMGDRAQLSLIATLLARAVEEQGRADEAFELSLVGERFAIQEDVVRPGDLADGAGASARGPGQRGRGRAARAGGRRARGGTDWLIGRGDAAWTLGVALFASGAETEAYQAWSDALSFYEHKGAVLSVASMRAAIDARTGRGVSLATSPPHDLRRYIACPTPTSIPSSSISNDGSVIKIGGPMDRRRTTTASASWSRPTSRRRLPSVHAPTRRAAQQGATGANSVKLEDDDAQGRSRSTSGSSRPTSHGGPFRDGWAYASAELVEHGETTARSRSTPGRSGCGCATRSAARHERGRRPRRRGCPRRAARAARPPTQRTRRRGCSRHAAVEHRPPARPQPPAAARAADRRAGGGTPRARVDRHAP